MSRTILYRGAVYQEIKQANNDVELLRKIVVENDLVCSLLCHFNPYAPDHSLRSQYADIMGDTYISQIKSGKGDQYVDEFVDTWIRAETGYKKHSSIKEKLAHFCDKVDWRDLIESKCAVPEDEQELIDAFSPRRGPAGKQFKIAEDKLRNIMSCYVRLKIQAFESDLFIIDLMVTEFNRKDWTDVCDLLEGSGVLPRYAEEVIDLIGADKVKDYLVRIGIDINDYREGNEEY